MNATTAAGGAFGLVDESPRTDEGVTLLSGTTFVRCGSSGAIRPGCLEGYYAADTRMLDRLDVLIDGAAVEVDRAGPGAGDAEHVSVGTIGDPSSPHLLVTRRLELAHELRLEVEVEDLAGRPRPVRIEVLVGSDFADIFQVKRGERATDGFVGAGPSESGLLLAYESLGFRRAVRVSCDREASVGRSGLTVDVELPGRGSVTVVVTATPEVHPHEPVRGPGPARSEVLHDLRHHAAADDPVTAEVWRRSAADLRVLLMSDPDVDGRTIVAAGAPWFLALFGRDSLLTSWATLPDGTELAGSVLDALAERQGTRVDDLTLEEPGRILHELREGERVRRHDGWGTTYYGSVDATPLFVVVLGEAHRQGLPDRALRHLLPAAEAAVGWVEGRRRGHPEGLLAYPAARRTSRSAALTLVNQGWKDSDDAIVHHDGRLADGPIALVEVQGYAVAAFRELAELRAATGTGDPEPLFRAAEELSAVLDERFWMPDEGTYALAIDGGGDPVRSVTSNPGHLLWAGVVPEARVAPLAERLLADDLFTGFGLRTLSSAHPSYNPLSYHRGSVWPHDTALTATGLAAQGQPGPARRLAAGLLDAADEIGRLPELFAGFPRQRYDPPLPYPTSCAPQAWAAAAGLLSCRLVLEDDRPSDRADLP